LTFVVPRHLAGPPDRAVAASSDRAALPPVGHVFVVNIENKGFHTLWGPHSAAPYLARTLRAKGVLLMREAGLPEPPIEAETRDRLTEFAHLERAIGKAGVLALRPLMMATGKEVWQLTLLRP